MTEVATVSATGPATFTADDVRVAHSPPEARGMRRDDVAMLVARRRDGRIWHDRFCSLPSILQPGDVVVVNTSATIPAALAARREDGAPVKLHLSTRLPAGLWTVEVRAGPGSETVPMGGRPGRERLSLPAGGGADLLAPLIAGDGRTRLWVASLELPLPAMEYLHRYGAPVRYGTPSRRWALRFYQTVYATEPGSAEMPSAGRPFTPEVITQLVARGIAVAPLLLHTGVSSLEAGERPYEEYYSVGRHTATIVNAVRQAGGRVVAVGTTTVRALETAGDGTGHVHPGSGWTDLVITPARGLHVVDGLLTGWHEPNASHLDLVEAIAGRQLLERSYSAAVERGYLWHEFGDTHLIMP